MRQLRDHNRIAFETVESHLEAAAFRVRERIDVQPPRTALATDPANPAAIDARTLIASHEGKNTRGKKRSLGTDSGEVSQSAPFQRDSHLLQVLAPVCGPASMALVTSTVAWRLRLTKELCESPV